MVEVTCFLSQLNFADPCARRGLAPQRRSVVVRSNLASPRSLKSFFRAALIVRPASLNLHPAFYLDRCNENPYPPRCANPKCSRTSSIAALIVRGFHARLPAWAFIYTLAILRLRLSTPARLSRSYPVLISLGLPGGPGARIVSAGLFAVVANGTTSRSRAALRERVCRECCRKHYGSQQR
jgi:hypothetical protein